MSETGYVYTLNDPRTGDPKYVGATKNPHQRYKGHLSGATNEDVEQWCDELESVGMKPKMNLIRVSPIDKLSETEQSAIDALMEEWDLLNKAKTSSYTPHRESNNLGYSGPGVDSATTTVQMDKQGRLYIPKAVRRSLDIEGESATVELDVRVVDDE